MYRILILTMLLLLNIISNGFALKHEPQRVFKTDSKTIYSICFTPAGEAIAIADNNHIKVCSVSSGQLIAEFGGNHSGAILSLEISKDSTLLVSGGKDSTIVIWDLHSRKVLKSIHFPKGIVSSLALSPDNKYLLAGNTDHKAYLYDLNNFQLLKEFANHTDVITSVAISPDGKYLASAGADKQVFIYLVDNKQLIESINTRSCNRKIVFSPDGQTLLSCNDNAKVCEWDLSQTSPINMKSNFNFKTAWMLSAAYFSDNKSFACGNLSGRIWICTKFSTYKTKVGGSINQIVFKPNEKTFLIVAVATSGKGVLIVDSKNMKLGKPYSGLKRKRNN